MEKETIVFDGENIQEISDFIAKHLSRMWEKTVEEQKEKAKKEKEYEEQYNEYVSELKKLRERYMGISGVTGHIDSNSTYSLSPSANRKGWAGTSGTPGNFGTSGNSGVLGASGRTVPSGFSYYIEETEIKPKKNWRIWEKDWKPAPPPLIDKKFIIDFGYGRFILRKGDAVVADENNLYTLKKSQYESYKFYHETTSSGPK